MTTFGYRGSIARFREEVKGEGCIWVLSRVKTMVGMQELSWSVAPYLDSCFPIPLSMHFVYIPI
ncbi:hypothetical protein GIB67_018036 [Kingdonia uniflora]|uniref:Uncharacterized protein n=1 Tax=Kingdonia uniflora TaxID=39325 RepID=A0A7J7NWZ7_9MAGN|nr:hypothetical protein GIB67_018036 [Kingdonia uniflora]